MEELLREIKDGNSLCFSFLLSREERARVEEHELMLEEFERFSPDSWAIDRAINLKIRVVALLKELTEKCALSFGILQNG